MRVRAMSLAIWIVSLLVGLSLSGCSPLQAHRSTPFKLQPGGPFADTSKEQCGLLANTGDEAATGEVDKLCEDRVREDSDKYRLYFSEYDDQGWSYRSGANDDPARLFSQDLQALLKNPAERVSVVVFVHGWKHNAAYDDSNVKAFRRLLSDLREVELQSGARCGRRVVGVYVG